jgi:hypothetical protein
MYIGYKKRRVILMQDEEMLCSLTEQGNFGLGIGKIQDKQQQKRIKQLQEQQQSREANKRNTNSSLSDI